MTGPSARPSSFQAAYTSSRGSLWCSYHPVLRHKLPESGEVFNSPDHCDRRLRGYSFAEGFDIVRKGGGSKSNPSWRFFVYIMV